MDKPFLYLVTKPKDLLSTVIKAVEGGVKMVQLREKEASFDEFCDMGRRLLAILRPLKIPLIINDRADVAHAIQADGVHLGQSDSSVHEARTLLGKQALIGLSINKIEEIHSTHNLPIDYVAASPVFSSKTKTDCGPPLGLKALKELCELSPHPVVAIGGIHEGNIVQVLRCGIKGVAVVSPIFDAPCPKIAAQNLVKKIDEEAIQKSALHCRV